MHNEFAKIMTRIKKSIIQDVPKNKTDWIYATLFIGSILFLYVAILNA